MERVYSIWRREMRPACRAEARPKSERRLARAELSGFIGVPSFGDGDDLESYDVRPSTGEMAEPTRRSPPRLSPGTRDRCSGTDERPGTLLRTVIRCCAPSA